MYFYVKQFICILRGKTEYSNMYMVVDIYIVLYYYNFIFMFLLFHVKLQILFITRKLVL